MTAIAALWHLQGRPDAVDGLSRMLASQRLYGPDDSRYRDGGAIALGRNLHRSLPEDRFDRQPLMGADGRLALVSDIRLDNRDDLAAALGLGGSSLERRSDADILMACLETWGEAAVPRLVGDFAFACWDEAKRCLLLARDYRGMRPLHFHRGRDFVAVASMPKGLHALADVPRAPDLRVTAEFLMLMPRHGTGSFWDGIERVPPASIVRIDAEKTVVERYWQAPSPASGRPRRDWVEGLRHHLDLAVCAQLRGSGEHFGTHLSAGYDSAAVTATAPRHAPGARISAFTAVPETGHGDEVVSGRIGDEGPLAALVAARYPSIEHLLVRAGSRSPVETLDRDFFLFEGPLLNRCNMGWITAILDQARARGIKVLLSGEIGNMTLSYAGTEYLPQLLRERRFLSLASRALELLRAGVVDARTLASMTVAPFVPKRVADWRTRRRGHDRFLHSAISPQAYSDLQLEKAAAERAFDTRYRGWTDGHRMRAWVIERSDPGTYYKGYVAGWGIDQRDPTGDRRLAEYCFSAPMAEFSADGRFRSLAARALADRLPREIIDARAKGLQTADWYLGWAAGRSGIREEITRLRECAPAAGLIDLGRLSALEESFPEEGWDRPEVVAQFRHAMLRGLSAGHFIRKAGGGNG